MTQKEGGASVYVQVLCKREKVRQRDGNVAILSGLLKGKCTVCFRQLKMMINNLVILTGNYLECCYSTVPH